MAVLQSIQQPWLAKAIVGLIAVVALGGCGDDGELLMPATTTVTTDVSDGQPTVIEYSDGRFEPDHIEVVRGTVVQITNRSDAPISVVMTGTALVDRESHEVEAGASFELRLDAAGAQVLTIGDDPDVTGSIMVVAEATR